MAETSTSYPLHYRGYADLPTYETNEGEAAPSYEGDNQDASIEAVTETEHTLNAEEEIIRIGNKFTLSLVTPTQLLDHLLLLNALHRLKLDVMDASPAYYIEYPGLFGSNTREKAWQVFIRRAVHRFEIWLQRIGNQSECSSLSQENYAKFTTSLVPLDILMVWHSYVLNPLEYYEDEVRGRIILRLKAFPLVEVTHNIDKQTLRPHNASNQDKDIFQRATGISFDPPLATDSSEVLHVPCPGCNETVWNVVHWLNTDGTGYAQQSFTASCRVCNLQFTRESLGVRKLTSEINTWKSQRNRHCLAGTRLNSYTGVPWKEASKLTHVLVAPMLSSSKFKNADVTPASMAKLLKFSHSEVEYHFRQSVLGAEGLRTDIQTPPRVRRILASYIDSSPLSVDLFNAVNVQQDFMEEIGKVTGFESIADVDGKMLVTAIARYCAYWELLVEQPIKCQVPSLDIDLCLHTHQLHWGRYRHTSLELLGRVPDHSSFANVEEFSKAVRATSAVWKDRYGVPYSQIDMDNPSKAPRIFSRILPSRKAYKAGAQVKDSLLWNSTELQPLTAPSTHFQRKMEVQKPKSGRVRVKFAAEAYYTTNIAFKTQYNDVAMPLRPLEPLNVSELYAPNGDAYSAYWGIVRRIFDENSPWSGYRPGRGV